MAVDEKLCGYVRAALGDGSNVREVKMFGGIGFMLNGNMVAACSERGLLLRVGEANTAAALARGAQPMVMRGRPVKGYVRVIDELSGGGAVKSWLRTARDFVETLPPKKEKPKAKKAKKNSA